MYGSPFMTGIGLGLTVAAPIGPMATLCIQRTLSLGGRAGVATGLGASTVHTMFGATALFGISTLSQSLEQNARLLYLGSGLVLAYMALRLYRRSAIDISAASLDRYSFGRTYASTILFGLANPITALLFVGSLPTLGAIDQEVATSFLIGIFSGSLLWWIVLTTLVAKVRRPVTTHLAHWTGKIAAVVLIAMAISLFFRATEAPARVFIDSPENIRQSLSLPKCAGDNYV